MRKAVGGSTRQYFSEIDENTTPEEKRNQENILFLQINKIQRNREERMKRIEYLDAMRGFTMMLVVMYHVVNFCLGGFAESFSFNQMMGEFRMPLFFFVSGFLLYRSHYIWNTQGIFSFLRKKIFVQIISPFLFLCINSYLMRSYIGGG